MRISPRTMRFAASGAIGAGVLTVTMLFGGVPAAAAAPAPVTGLAIAGPHGYAGIPAVPATVPARWGHGGWGHGGHHGWRGGGFWRHGRWWNWWW